MKFINNIDQKEYDDFVSNNKNGHFLESYLWGQFAKDEKNLIPHYVGLKGDDNKLCATALLLEKKLPLNLSYFYIPRGPVLDYDNKELLKEFFDEIKSYTKKFRSIFIKIDPAIEIGKENYLGEKIDTKYDKDFVSQFKSIGFKHLGFTKNFETMQPRYTFRIDNKQNIDDIIDHFSKTTKQRIKKAESLETSVRLADYNDIEAFYKLMILTENRKDFVTHNLRYYQTLFKLSETDKNFKSNIFLGSINLDKNIERLDNEIKAKIEEFNRLEKLEKRSKKENVTYKELMNQINQLKDELEKYKENRKKYGDDIILSAHYIVSYGNKAWVLYAGNHNVLSETYVNYKTYLEHIKYYHDKVEIYDQFGTIGDLRKENHLLGLHEFKKKFGGDYVEFIGEFDLVTKPFYYLLFTRLVPKYRSIIKKIAKRKNKNKKIT